MISKAFASGELGIDKVVELTRFATAETEEHLIVWAQGVSCGRIREKGDLLHRSLQEAQEAEQARSLSWWYFQANSRFGLSAELPAADGAVVARALERLADHLAAMPGEDREVAPAEVPGSRVHLPGVRGAPVHPGPSHRVVGVRGSHRSGQPGAGVHVPL